MNENKRTPDGYLLKYESKERLRETFYELIKIADELNLPIQLTYRETIIQFFKAVYGDGAHDEDLESRLRDLPNICLVEKDYLEKMI